jgi:hypothetical protein
MRPFNTSPRQQPLKEKPTACPGPQGADPIQHKQRVSDVCPARCHCPGRGKHTHRKARFCPCHHQESGELEQERETYGAGLHTQRFEMLSCHDGPLAWGLRWGLCPTSGQQAELLEPLCQLILQRDREGVHGPQGSSHLCLQCSTKPAQENPK